MPTPRVLCIRRLEDSPTANIGSFSGLHERLQFFGSVVPSPAKPASRWHAVLHRFRLSGAYVGTDYWESPELRSEDEGALQAHEHLAAWLAKLSGLSFQDIHIRVFSTRIGDILFGLVKGSKGQSLVLQPEGLVFKAPWSGDHEQPVTPHRSFALAASR